ncbi:MAG: protein BatD [Verrucomicrobia bacterium]|nr:protein BatD [Verrucomicrobiota bacterium]MBI3869029.1 protein BatD [Verrucomicrobiota bacterium]
MPTRTDESASPNGAPQPAPFAAPPRSPWDSLSCLLLPLAALILTGLSSSAASVRLEIDQESIPVGDTATLNLIIEGAQPRLRPTFPPVAGLHIAAAGDSTQVSIVNGERTMQRSLSFSVTGIKPGSYTIGPVDVLTDAGAMRAPAIKARVTPASTVDVGNRPAFLRIETPKTEAYVGEALPFEVQLFVEEGRGLQLPQIEGEGFNFSKIVNLPPVKRNVGGRVMNLVTFKCVATAVKAGALKLGPAATQLEIPAPGGRQDFFGFFRPYQAIRVTADPAQVEVRPLPPGAPPDFTGAVGSFQMTYSAGPRSLAVGDPITMKIAISGDGSIEGLSLPNLDHWKGFKFYPPNARSEPRDALEVAGTRFFEQVVVPQSPEIQGLPEFRWTYFDPASKSYRTLKADPVPLQLTAATAPTLPLPMLGTNAAGGSGSTLAPALAHIRPELGSIVALPPAAWRQPWYLIAQLLPFGLWATLRAGRWRAETLGRNPRLLRRKQAEKEVAEGLRQMKDCAQRNEGDVFFAAMSRVLRCQIGERLDIPESGITESVIREKLLRRGLSEAEAEGMEELFRMINQHRYAPSTSPAELSELIPKAREAIEALRRLRE